MDVPRSLTAAITASSLRILEEEEEQKVQLVENQLLFPLSIIFNQKISKFPGALPQSVDASNVRSLSQGYVAALKADGDRIYIFIAKNKMLLLRRDKRYTIYTLNHTFEKTYIFDGEFIEKKNLVLLFDSIYYNHKQNTIMFDYRIRLDLCNHFLNVVVPEEHRFEFENTYIQHPKPLKSNFSWGTTYKAGTVNIQSKPVYAIEDVESLWENRFSLSYDCDGIIFSRLWCRYQPFAENPSAFLKWKLDVTVDFEIQPVVVPSSREESRGCMDFQPDKKVPVDNVFDMFIHTSEESLHNVVLLCSIDTIPSPFSTCVMPPETLDICSKQVCEFGWNNAKRNWEFLRIRKDKIAPNTLETVLSCIMAMKDNIHLKDIANHSYF